MLNKSYRIVSTLRYSVSVLHKFRWSRPHWVSDSRSVKNTYNFEYFARLLKDVWNANIFTYEFLKKNIKATFKDWKL